MNMFFHKSSSETILLKCEQTQASRPKHFGDRYEKISSNKLSGRLHSFKCMSSVRNSAAMILPFKIPTVNIHNIYIYTMNTNSFMKMCMCFIYRTNIYIYPLAFRFYHNRSALLFSFTQVRPFVITWPNSEKCADEIYQCESPHVTPFSEHLKKVK